MVIWHMKLRKVFNYFEIIFKYAAGWFYSRHILRMCMTRSVHKKNGGTFVTVEKPLIIYNEDGSYTDEIMTMYNKGKENS